MSVFPRLRFTCIILFIPLPNNERWRPRLSDAASGPKGLRTRASDSLPVSAVEVQSVYSLSADRETLRGVIKPPKTVQQVLRQAAICGRQAVEMKLWPSGGGGGAQEEPKMTVSDSLGAAFFHTNITTQVPAQAQTEEFTRDTK